MERPFSIYVVTNAVNGKWYVGKTGNTVADRWIDHKSNARRGANTYLYRAMRKHGEENFDVETVAEVSTEEAANNLERVWILLLSSHKEHFGYNLTMGGDGVRANEATRKKCSEAMKGRHHTPEARAKISASNKGRKHSQKTLDLIRAKNLGRVTSLEVRAKQSAARKGRFGGENHPMFGRKHTPEAIEKTRAANLGRPSWNKGIPFGKESRQKMSASQKAMNEAKPENRLRIAAQIRELWSTPSYREMMMAARKRKKEERANAGQLV